MSLVELTKSTIIPWEKQARPLLDRPTCIIGLRPVNQITKLNFRRSAISPGTDLRITSQSVQQILPRLTEVLRWAIYLDSYHKSRWDGADGLGNVSRRGQILPPGFPGFTPHVLDLSAILENTVALPKPGPTSTPRFFNRSQAAYNPPPIVGDVAIGSAVRLLVSAP